jgi:hypothetical protein
MVSQVYLRGIQKIIAEERDSESVVVQMVSICLGEAAFDNRKIQAVD